MQQVSFGGDGYPGNCARICDSCLAAACTVYCHTESAYLCHRCDEYIHMADPIALQHERVWLCTACENAEAAFICHPDAASLCVNCDILIHSANQLAYRHNRVPILPLSGIGFSSSTNHLQKPQGGMPDIVNETLENKSDNQLEEDQTSSWLLLDLDTNDNLSDSVFTYDGKVNENLDVVKYNSCGEHQCQDQRYDQQQLSNEYQEDNGSDSVVPVQSFEENEQQQQQKQIYVIRENEASKNACISNTSSSSQSATTTDISNSYHPRLSEGTTNLFPNLSLLKPLQFGPTNREERVLRYKEKRKVRKFEKKIRYAARKANAENRPRVKCRFARKTRMELEMDVDKLFSTEDCGYGIVPSN